MIKGVNKRVVEITGTDHEYFEKAVLYVKADKSGVPQEVLNEEAKQYLNRIVPAKRKSVGVLLPALVITAALAVLALLLIYFLV